jgi:hypothetical protein
MRKIYLNIIVISVIISLFIFLDTSVSEKNPRLIFTAQTNKEIYYPLDPIYFNLFIKNVSGEYINIKRENYPLRISLINEKKEVLNDPLFPIYSLMNEVEVNLAPGDSLNLLKAIRFHHYIDPFYIGKYKLIIKYGQSDSLIKEVTFQEPKNPIEKEIYEEYKKLYREMFYEGKYYELKDYFKQLYYKIKSQYDESDYLCYISSVFFMQTINEKDYETFKNEFFYVLDKKHNSYCVDEILYSYYNYITNPARGVNRKTVSDFYHTLISRYDDNNSLKEVMKLSFGQTFYINQMIIE